MAAQNYWLDELSEEWVSQPEEMASSPGSAKSSGSILVVEKPTLADEVAQLEADSDPKKTNDVVGEGESSSMTAMERDPEKDESTVAAPLQDEHPSTMRISKEESSSKETPPWKLQILEDVAGAQAKDLFSPMKLESIFHQPPSPPRPTAIPKVVPKTPAATTKPAPTLQPLQLNIPGTPPKKLTKRQLGAKKRSLIPLPSSIAGSTPPTMQNANRTASPRPPTQLQMPTPSSTLDNPNTSTAPRTSPLNDQQKPGPSVGTSMLEASSVFKPVATSTVKHAPPTRLPSTLQFPTQQPRVAGRFLNRAGKRKVDRPADDSGSSIVPPPPPPPPTNKENQPPKIKDPIPVKPPSPPPESPVDEPEVPNADGPEDGSDSLSEIMITRYQTIGGSVGYTPMSVKGRQLPRDDESSYPSSPPWVPRGVQPVETRSNSDRNSESQEGSQEDYLPPNEKDAEYARQLEANRIHLPRPLPKTPALPPPRAPTKKNRPLPQPISSPDDPFASQPSSLQRQQKQSRTPSPTKKDSMAQSSKSPMKLFADYYDTFTKSRLVRRISQLEGEVMDKHAEESGEASGPEQNSDHLYGTNPEISVIEPPGTPLNLQENPHPVLEDSQISLRRSRQRKDSSSSMPNDGVHGPKSPLKERTPKRLRRSMSGNLGTLILMKGQTAEEDGEDEHEEGDEEDEADEEESERSTDASEHAGSTHSHAAPSVSTPARKVSEVDNSISPQLSSPQENSGIQEPDSVVSNNSDMSDKAVFSGSSEGGNLVGKEFRGIGIGVDMQNDDRKPSVTTQDFLAEAEEVMGRIRAAKAGKGDDPSWISEGTTGLESFLTGDMSLSTEEIHRMREKLKANLSANSSNQDQISPKVRKRQGSFPTRSAASTLVNMPRRNSEGAQGIIHEELHEDHSAEEHDVIDALCAAVSSESLPGGLTKNVTLRTKQRNSPIHSNDGKFSRESQYPVRNASSESHSSRSDIRIIHPTQVEHLIPKHIGAMTYDPIRKIWTKSKSPPRRSISPSFSDSKSDNGTKMGSRRFKYRQEETDDDPFHGISDLSVDEELEARALMDASQMQEMITEMEAYVIADSEPEVAYRPKTVRQISREEIRRTMHGREFDDEDSGGDHWRRAKDNADETVANLPSFDDNPDHSSWIQETQFDATMLNQNKAESSNGSMSNHSTNSESRGDTRSTSWNGSEEERKAVANSLEGTGGQLSVLDSSDEDGSSAQRPNQDDVDYSDGDQELADEGEDDEYGLRQRSASGESAEYSSPAKSRQMRSRKSADKSSWTESSDADITADQSSIRPSSRSKSKSYRPYSNRGKRLPSVGRSFIGRPVSRINEEEEDDHRRHETGDSDTQKISLSSSTALTPMASKGNRGSKSAPPPSTVCRQNVSFHLSSPLPELSYQFETTKELLNLELSYVAQRHAKGKQPVSARTVENSFSLAQNDLVRNLTDVEPFEPYWEHMKYLKLADRKILTLHGLQEWCPRISELDVSNNEIGQVSGVPNTVRNLNISNNHLSGLTAWGHLTNIQYMDLSKNHLDSLGGLRHMYHLRELRADDNQIESLDEIMNLDGLTILSVKRNNISKLNFEKCTMSRLADLDLTGNGLTSISHLEKLRALSSLCLDQNNISSLEVSPGEQLENFRILKLSGNKFSQFDVASFPNLRTLYIDDNELEKIDGLRKAKHLDSLSMREQCKESERVKSGIVPLGDMFEVRKIYASGNAICTLDLRLDFLNLQYLELAGVQLTTLQANFGHLVSNVRVLNLNYNAISDLKPLFGIVRLKKLLLVGNRIRSMRKIAGVLECFPSLSFLDLRSNPLTLGFYPPVMEASHTSNINGNAMPREPFTLAGADEARDRVFQSRLDLDTAVLRRRYEIVINERCPRVKHLDGLAFQKSEVFRKDTVYDELRNMGLIKTMLPLGDSEGAQKGGKLGQPADWKSWATADIAAETRKI
ncbi:hypothetical protein DFH27DRAFT_354001 [Peziza echinospora]|nr:hypothetical protein DFH27DRAFT_354001 [Peziza echinospora]